MNPMIAPAPDSASQAPPPALTAEEEAALAQAARRRPVLVIVSAVVALVLVAGLVWAAVFLVQNPSQASSVRDVFIIFMALEFMVIGVVLTVLVVQVSVLTNLLKHEIKPILEATNDTVNTVRGTTLFVSENLTEPIVQLNAYVAGLSKAVEALGNLASIFRRR
jgi:hypothetical protein